MCILAFRWREEVRGIVSHTQADALVPFELAGLVGGSSLEEPLTRLQMLATLRQRAEATNSKLRRSHLLHFSCKQCVVSLSLEGY